MGFYPKLHISRPPVVIFTFLLKKHYFGKFTGRSVYTKYKKGVGHIYLGEILI